MTQPTAHLTPLEPVAAPLTSTPAGRLRDVTSPVGRDQLAVPRGWTDMVALGPIGRPDALCFICDAPAVARALAKWRCADHPPQPGEWGAGLNWAPAPQRYCAPRRCYCGRCLTSLEDPATTDLPGDELAARRRRRGASR